MEENKNNTNSEERAVNNSNVKTVSVEEVVSEKQNKMEWPSGHSKETSNTAKEADNKPKENTSNQEKEETKEGEDAAKNNKWQTWLTLAGIAIIIIIIALPNGRRDGEINGGIDTKAGEGEVLEDTTDPTTTENSESSSISAPAGTSTSAMTAVSRGDFTYQFEGIVWEFAPDGDKTKVMFKFDKFSRRSGNYVTFGRPFKLGSYPGTCRVVEQLAIDPATEPDTGLGFVQCLKIDGSGTEIGLFQDSSDSTMVMAKNRTISSQGKVSNFREFFSRDITTIVR